MASSTEICQEEHLNLKPAAVHIPRFFAVRKCSSLKGPAIFWAREDCNIYVEKGRGRENEKKADYKSFDVIQDAIEYISACSSNPESLLTKASTGSTTAKTTPAPPAPPATSTTSTTAAVAVAVAATVPRAADFSTEINDQYLSEAQKKLNSYMDASKATRKYLAEIDPKNPRVENARKRSAEVASLETSQHAPPPPPPPHTWFAYPPAPFMYPPPPPPPLLPGYPGYPGTHHLWPPNGLLPYSTPIWNSEYDSPNKKKISLEAAKVVDRTLGVGILLEAADSKDLDLPPFEEMFAKLKKYKAENGRLDISTRDSPHAQLRKWCLRMRTLYAAYKEGKPSVLTTIQIAKLAELGFDLNPSRRLTFHDRSLEWLEYKTKQGCDPEKDSELGRWVDLIKGKYGDFCRGVHTNLTREQVDRLTAFGFGWPAIESLRSLLQPIPVDSPRPPKKPVQSWKKRFAELVAYKEERGNLDVVITHSDLGQWVKGQRVQYKNFLQGKTSTLDAAKVAQLQDVGFVFDGRHLAGVKRSADGTVIPGIRRRGFGSTKTWDVSYKELVAYKEKHGHCLVPASYPELGGWVRFQRKQYKKLTEGLKSHLTPKKIAKLRDADFVFIARPYRQGTTKTHNK
jgi:hypothetical protein